jgi:uncharacterized lipoprotein YddW (UPF0748 family)
LFLFWMIGAMALFSPWPIAHAQSPVFEEVRGVWLTHVGSGVMFAPWGVQRALGQLADLHFNTVYPVVWNRGHTFYPSDVATTITGRRQAPLFAVLHPGSDVLQEIVDIGDRRQLRMIPWFEYGLMVPRQSRLARPHPAWLTTDATGHTTDPNSSQAIPPMLQDWYGHQNLWLNPFHPNVQEFLLAMITEVVRTYDVDGIQLDDHFGLPVEIGYDPVTVRLYQQSHQGQSPPADPTDPAWMRWRADQLTVFMGRIAEAVTWMLGRSTGWAIAGFLRHMTHLFFSEVVGLLLTWGILGGIGGPSVTLLLRRCYPGDRCRPSHLPPHSDA